ncbi:IQ calmodulin-binding motif family protein [Acanthocheilonema viteae]
MESMNHNERKIKRIPTESFKRVVSHVSEENTVYDSQLDSFCQFSQSQTFLKDIRSKEDALFSVPYSPLDKQIIRQKTPSADDIYNYRSGVSLRFSPGTNASNMTMKRKLELLKKRYELQKTTVRKSSLSHDHNNLYKTEEKFLSSVPEALNSNDHERNENTDASFRFPLNATLNSISNSSKATNATYVIQSLVDERDFTDQCKKTEMDKQSAYLAALTSWLNYLLDEKSDADNSSEILAMSKKDADLYLRKLLTSTNDIPAIKNNELQKHISYKCFTAANELSKMRSRFRLLYESSPIPNDIATIVKGGKIAVRMDRQVYADVGLQTELLSLLLSFHPFYLLLGLETVLSINIRKRIDGKNQLRIIASVVMQNIFKNPKIMNNRKYVQGRGKILINNLGAEALLQHFLTKICQFLFIVDKAWRDNTISRKNRCLFVKWSAYKSINDVVAMLSRELMTGTSNLPKTLSRLGVFLDRRQGFFEQFQYHVADPLKDLSNGMILGRTVEILANLQYNTVIQCLRDPSGDRLRKVSNVRTVIDFAKQKGIIPEDLYVDIDGILQGNIDEILALLWLLASKELSISKSDNCNAEIDSISQQLLSLFGISYEIRNPLELADGKLFSLLWKQYYSYGAPFELFDGTTVLEQIASAAEHHFGIPSSMLMRWKNIPEEKTLCLFTRIFIARIYECYKITSAAITIQRAFRRYHSTSKMNYDIPHKLNTSDQLIKSYRIITKEDSKRMKASFTIQRYFRGWFARILYRKMKCDKTSQEREAKAIIIQKFIRGWLARTFYRKMKCDKILQEREAKAVIIQKFIRGWLARTFYRKMKCDKILQEREAKAVIIQKFIRGWLARTFYRKMKCDKILQEREAKAVIIQKFIRGWLARTFYRKMKCDKILQEREAKAVIIQKFIRGWLARTFYRKMKCDKILQEREAKAVIIQKFIRGWLARTFYRKMKCDKILQEREAKAVIIQKFIRGWLARTFYRKMKCDKILQEREAKAVIIQRYARGWIVRKNYRKMQHEVALYKQEQAAITLQRYLREWIVRRKYQLMHQKKMIIHEQENAFIVQNSISATECSNDEVENKIHGCEVINDAECLRILRELRKQHNRLRIRRQKFLQVVENKIKCALLLKAERDRRIKAATIIQAWWRGYLFRKRHVTIRNEIAASRVAHKEAMSNEERFELMQPIMNRVMNAMKNLNSKHLYIRYKATEVLQKFVGLSELCAQYVFDNGGLECILDSLEGCNRGVGSTEVVIPLCSILWSVLKFKIIRGKLDEQRQKDIVRQCYHFMLAFHKVPDVVTNLSAVIIALNGNNKQHKKAHYFVAQLAKRFAKLSECDERVVALRKLQDCLLN